MNDQRFIVVGLARARAPWFRDVASWANAAVIPVEFHKCIGIAEARGRLGGPTPVSALLVDAGVPGLDRSLLAAASARGAAVLVVADGSVPDDGWIELGADAVLPVPLGPETLVALLERHATRAASAVAPTAASMLDRGQLDHPVVFTGRLTAVIGAGGAGTSTLAMAAAQALAHQSAQPGAVLLADLALRAHQAMYHDSGDVIPGLQELVEAHGRATPPPSTIRSFTFDVERRGYRLLLGLRRPRDWTALAPVSLHAALAGLMTTFRHVVADVDVDLDGERETGSHDIEDRTAAARLAVTEAERVLVVLDASLKGLHDGSAVIRDVVAHRGTDGVVAVVNRAPKRRPARAEIAATLAELTSPASLAASPLFVPTSATLELAHRSGTPLPESVVEVARSALGLRRSPRHRRSRRTPAAVSWAPDRPAEEVSR